MIAGVAAVGVADGHELAVLERDELGRLAGGAAGVTCAGGAELSVLWVREDRRGQGRGRRLLRVFEEAAREGWPAGHRDHLLQKEL
jgi:GNAT superfamily N-acetyltransferase